jgi:hypothetical protein
MAYFMDDNTMLFQKGMDILADLNNGYIKQKRRTKKIK